MEEVYVKQPLDFKNEKILNHVYKLSKVLYGLKQASRAQLIGLVNFSQKMIDLSFDGGSRDEQMGSVASEQYVLSSSVYFNILVAFSCFLDAESQNPHLHFFQLTRK